jgi:hypothetical protein
MSNRPARAYLRLALSPWVSFTRGRKFHAALCFEVHIIWESRKLFSHSSEAHKYADKVKERYERLIQRSPDVSKS